MQALSLPLLAPLKTESRDRRLITDKFRNRRHWSMKRKKLRELLQKPGLVRAPGAFDAWSARLVEMAGFSAVYMTGYGASASVLGKPDIGFMTMSEGGRQAGDMGFPPPFPLFRR